MAELWIESRLWFRSLDDKQYERLLLEFVKPVLLDLESLRPVGAFHFLFESGPHFLLRIEITGNELEKIKSLVKKYLPRIDDFLIQKNEEELFAEYRGESEDYGEQDWLIAKKAVEIGSRMGIAKVDPAFKKGRKFDEAKLLHCFLNSLGYSMFGIRKQNRNVSLEALFHLNQFIGRMLITRGQKAVDPEIESEMETLFHEQIENWKGRIIETL